MLGFKKWVEGAFSNDQKASVQDGIGVRGKGTIGASKIKNPPDGVRTPSENSPIALKDRATGGGQQGQMPMQQQGQMPVRNQPFNKI